MNMYDKIAHTERTRIYVHIVCIHTPFVCDAKCRIWRYVQINPIEIWQTKFPVKVLTTISNNLIHAPLSAPHRSLALFRWLSTVRLSISLSPSSAVLQSNLWSQLLTVAIVLYSSTLIRVYAGCEVSRLMIARPRAGVARTRADTYKTLKMCVLRTRSHTHTHTHTHSPLTTITAVVVCIYSFPGATAAIAVFKRHTQRTYYVGLRLQ
jgi:hypothetical protein